MKKTRISHVKLRVQIPACSVGREEKPPQELIDSYLKGTKETAKKTYQHLKEAVPDVETVIEKIIKPRVESHKSFFNPDVITRRGTKVKDSLTPSRTELVRQAQRWLKKVKYTHRYDSKEYIESIKNMAEYYAKEMTRLVLPFRGYKDKIRGVGPIAAEWLTGVLTVVKRVSREEVIEGEPIDITAPLAGCRHGVTKPDLAGIFRKRFNNQIISSGSQIIKHAYQPSELTYGNEQINRLVNAFAKDEFVPSHGVIPCLSGRQAPGMIPFTPGGESHVDFMMVDGELFLDVQVSIKA